jgi:hypothetical protein
LFVEKGLAVVQEATELDTDGDYKNAIKKYEQALLLFQKATKGIHSERAN